MSCYTAVFAYLHSILTPLKPVEYKCFAACREAIHGSLMISIRQRPENNNLNMKYEVIYLNLGDQAGMTK